MTEKSAAVARPGQFRCDHCLQWKLDVLLQIHNEKLLCTRCLGFELAADKLRAKLAVADKLFKAASNASLCMSHSMEQFHLEEVLKEYGEMED